MPVRTWSRKAAELVWVMLPQHAVGSGGCTTSDATKTEESEVLSTVGMVAFTENVATATNYDSAPNNLTEYKFRTSYWERADTHGGNERLRFQD
jgi:hypothetical protein